ncbi:hypothetical protein PVAG01_07942 [Phlyctema vagabunda]|uniref:BHLH domain-containing protein n=1 Tax=Phlyctema vagabunda TaxID=108571 RepID=A0ABR4PDV2_9HELO
MSSVMDTMHSPSPGTLSGDIQLTRDGKKRTKKRVRAFTSDDRASHRIIEKQRREALNQQFLELARLLPGLANVRRLSKSVIVSESISYLKAQREIRLAAAKEVRLLLTERDNALERLNGHQGQFNAVTHGKQAGRPISEALLNLLNVEDEKFGSFPGGFGDNGPNDEQEEEHLIEGTTQEQNENNENVPFISEAFGSTNEHLIPENNPENGFLKELHGQIQPLPHHDAADHLMGTTNQLPIHIDMQEIDCTQPLSINPELGIGWTDMGLDQAISVQHAQPSIASNFEDFSQSAFSQHGFFPGVSFPNSQDNFFMPQNSNRQHENLQSYQVHDPY